MYDLKKREVLIGGLTLINFVFLLLVATVTMPKTYESEVVTTEETEIVVEEEELPRAVISPLERDLVAMAAPEVEEDFMSFTPASNVFLSPNVSEKHILEAESKTETETQTEVEETTEAVTIVVEEVVEEVSEESFEEESTAEQVVEEPVEEYVEPSWDGSVLTARKGVNYGPTGKETYYNLRMNRVVQIMHEAGFEGEYWVRDDGVKMFGDYIMVAANFDMFPRGTIVETSLGTAIVCDTGDFAASNPTQLDIAVTW